MRVALALLLLAGCASDPTEFDFPPKGCDPSHAAACEELYAACLQSSACKKPVFDFERPQTCIPTCKTVKQDCHRRCPVWTPPPPPLPGPP